MYKVSLLSGVEFMCSETQTILEAAKMSNVAIEHSCMTGRCGACVASISEGKTKPIAVEESLSEDDVISGKLYTCCRAPLTDIQLNISDLGEIGCLRTLTLPCRVDSLVLMSVDVISLVLRLPPNSGFKFLAGQYLNLICGDIRRSYSIANAPRADGKLELQIKRVDQGVMSAILFSQAKQNDLFRIEGPLGTFSYRDDNEENIILMATGTGIAPIKALLESFLRNESTKRIFVVWGARFKKDLYLNLKCRTDNYQLLPVLSREDCDGFFYGYVQDAVLSLNLELEKSSVYACGSENMIKDARDYLMKNGLSAKRFHSDAFVSSS
ncbi:FAD-binding oxidoreductase [Pseudomonadales bacterium]|nr:FAD-binding oxidoreductase [Pseudomonadales bacterium]